jgi:lysozyme
MKLNKAGLALIKSHEGLRLDAYPDPATNADPWTIGYGHTSAAGAPKVYKGLKITKQEAEDILKRDLETFERHVNSRLKVPVNPNQFAALVSFCFNVGPGNFDKSGVLKAVNAGQFDLVPARLMLWNKAAGKVMRGLTRRRAEEGDLFVSERGRPNDTKFITGAEPAKGKSAIESTTNIAAGVGAAAAVTSAGRQLTTDAVETGAMLPPTWIIVALALVTLLAAVWIIKERIYKSNEEGS